MFTTQPDRWQHRTHCAQIGTYTYLCRTGSSPHYEFTYSHVPFGTTVWHGVKKAPHGLKP